MTYTDDNTTVWYNKKPVLRLNKQLLEKQKVSEENLEKLKELHIRRMEIEEQLQTCRVEDKRVLLECWTDNQFSLQRAWGFHEDAKFHRFWDMLGCRCPQMDNDDAYPSGYYVRSGGCPIHGDF